MADEEPDFVSDPYDLTNVAKVRQWLNSPENTTSQNNILQSEITALSQATLTKLQVPTVISRQYDDIYDGTGGNRIMLRQRPVTSIIALTFGNLSIAASSSPAMSGSSPQAGYLLSPWNGFAPARAQSLTLSGYCYPQGRSTIGVSYMAGYRTTVAALIPADPFQLRPLVPAGLWAADLGVSFVGVGGALTPLTAVLENPGAGEYVPPDFLLSPGSFFLFNAADTGKAIVFTCSYVPMGLQNAVMELVSERYRYRDRIGQRNKALGGNETMGYDPNDFPLWFVKNIKPYIPVAPI